MFKALQKFFMHFEWKLSLWNALGGGGLVSSFGIAAWAAAASDWLSNYGPIGWVAAGFVAVLVFALAWLVVGFALYLRATAKIKSRMAEMPSGINILEKNFEKKIITQAELFVFPHIRLSDKHFRECRFSGPIVMTIGDHVTLSHCNHNLCNFVIAEDDTTVTGITMFSSSSFINCDFDFVTFILPRDVAQAMYKHGNTNFVGAPLFKPEIPSLDSAQTL